MSRKKMDETDLKIVRSLREDARKPISKLASDVGISRPTVMKRLRRMLEKETIGIETGINLKELGLRVGCVGLEVKGAESRSKVKKMLENCPRVLMVIAPFNKITFTVYVFGEDQDTLRSTIYGFAAFPDTSITHVSYSDPPLYPKTFPIQIGFKKNTVAPCGLKCSDCFSYNEGVCVGCPTVIGYKGSLR
jgi:DNA-binding Lrp family transcriptional regulator